MLVKRFWDIKIGDDTLREHWRIKKIAWKMAWSDFDTTTEFWIPLVLSAITSCIVTLLATK